VNQFLPLGSVGPAGSRRFASLAASD